MCKDCDKPNEHGDYMPCCYMSFSDGKCTAAYGDSGISSCIHCGGEMFEEDGKWYHHSQSHLPIEKRYLEHNQQWKPED